MTMINRLTHEQYVRLVNISEFLTKPVPARGWLGSKKEARHLTQREWDRKISIVLYDFYVDTYHEDMEFTMGHVYDFMDDGYITDLISYRGWFRRVCCL